MPQIAASVLNADASKWKEWLPQLEEALVDRIQFDIMDNKYVPNTGVEKRLIAELRPHTRIFFETHLMTERPELKIGEFAEMGSQLIIFHAETTKQPLKLIQKIKDHGVQAGIAVNNNTQAEKIVPYLHKADLALVMGVEAGFGGQEFNPAALDKIRLLRRMIDEQSMECKIEVDGGVNAQTARECVAAGADVLVAGTFLFRHPNGIVEAVKELRKP